MGGQRRESDESLPSGRPRNFNKPLIALTVPEEGPLDYNEDMPNGNCTSHFFFFRAVLNFKPRA